MYGLALVNVHAVAKAYVERNLRDQQPVLYAHIEITKKSQGICQHGAAVMSLYYKGVRENYMIWSKYGGVGENVP
jgi:hypothetical protein